MLLSESKDHEVLALYYHILLEGNKAKQMLSWLWTKIKNLNMFNSESDESSLQNYERLMTRIYIILILMIFLVLLFYISITEQTNTYTIYHPTQSTVEDLFDKYPNTIHCPCTSVSTSLDTFINAEFNLHQICYSKFILNEFISQFWTLNNTHHHPYDFIPMTGSYFSAVATICNVFSVLISLFINNLQRTSFSTVTVLSSMNLAAQVNKSINGFKNQISDFSNVVHDYILSIQPTYQPLSMSMSSFSLQITSNDSIQIEPIDFNGCSCLLESHKCSEAAGLYVYDLANDSFILSTTVNGINVGCLPYLSLLHSSFECWYSEGCYQSVSYINLYVKSI